jgi:hypothetical protein
MGRSPKPAPPIGVRFTTGLGPTILELEQQEYCDKDDKGWTKSHDKANKQLAGMNGAKRGHLGLDPRDLCIIQLVRYATP